MEQCYPFLDNFEICGVIDEKTEKEHLTLTHVPTNDQTSIDCFHTVMGQLGTTDATYESTEGKKIDALDLESKKAGVFGAAQFFSENGLDAFKIYQDMHEYTQIESWANRILPFVAKYNQDALKKHMNNALESCIFEGTPHEPCLLANLLPFKEFIADVVPIQKILILPSDLIQISKVTDTTRDIIKEHVANIITSCMSSDKPKDCLLTKLKPFTDVLPSVVPIPKLIKLPNFDDIMRGKMASNPDAAKSPDFFSIFSEFRHSKHSNYMDDLISRNPNAPLHDEYRRLFSSYRSSIGFYDAKIKENIVRNQMASRFPEYERYFTDAQRTIRQFAASNLNAPRLPTYHTLFTDIAPEVRGSAALNPNAPQISKYKVLFTDPHPMVQDKACDQLSTYQRIHHTNNRFGCD